jgi:histone H4
MAEVKKGGKLKYRVVLRDNIQGLTKPAIQRLAHAAGCTRISGLVYEEIRGITKDMMNKYLMEMLTFMQHRRGRQLSDKDFKAMLDRHGIKFYGSGEYDLCKQKKDYAKTRGACLFIAKLPFFRIVKELSQEYVDLDKTKFSAIAISNFQYFIEGQIIDLFERANAMANHRGVETVTPKDLQLASSCGKPKIPARFNPDAKPKEKKTRGKAKGKGKK